MAEPDRLFELRRTRNHTVIVLVSVVDRRIVPALHFVSRLACSDSRALHISVDTQQTRRLAADWMNLGLSWLPLHIRDATAPSLPVSVREAVRREETADRVTVVVPELDIVRWWHPLLYRGRARRIAEQLQPLPGVTTVIVPFYVPPRVEAPAAEVGERRG
ncbi:MAG: hypothetical protein M3326_06615 [Actinomycetota bacterium]|nr:hypothetical protein [Actinomycetota bacterium]